MLLTVDINKCCEYAVRFFDMGQVFPAKLASDFGPRQDDILHPGLEEDLHASMAWLDWLAAIIILRDKFALLGDCLSSLDPDKAY